MNISLLLIGLTFSTTCFSAVERLSYADSHVMRSWMTRLVSEQIRLGPSPKWVQKDCVGLVRYVYGESLKAKDAKWYRSHGISKRGSPPDLQLDLSKRVKFAHWKQPEGPVSPYVSAIGMIQENAEFVSKEVNQAKPGDLLFYDFGDVQHVMIWMGTFVAYHTGTTLPKDNGLRKYHLSTLIKWKDTRWRPIPSNPNFIGVFKLSSLSY